MNFAPIDAKCFDFRIVRFTLQLFSMAKLKSNITKFFMRISGLQIAYWKALFNGKNPFLSEFSNFVNFTL